MRQNALRTRIDPLARAVLAAALSVAALGAAQAQSPASATGTRSPGAQPSPSGPVLTPKRSFDDPATPAAAPAAAPAATPDDSPAAPPTNMRTPVATPAATPAAAQAHAPAAPAATANGLTVADWDKYTAKAKLLPTTVASAQGQPEGRETWWDYIAKTVDDERVADGRAVLAKYGKQLGDISQQYQVDPATLVAIFGIETNYGRQVGKTDVLNAWLTRACTENKTLWEKNAYASVRLLRDGVVPADNFVGSWSGAFGMTQFIPTSFYELAADGDGDGKIDLYNSLPDALASTANHLRKRRAKWTHGLPAVVEVRVPADVAAAIPPAPDAEYVGSQDRRSIAQWAQAGLKQGDGSALKLAAGNDQQAYLFAPTGAKGPVFLATVNFDAILHYNQSRRYGLAVALLLNRLQGGPALATAWPTDDPGLSRAQIKEVQEMLNARGYDVGTADGIPGAKTRDAVRAEQEKRNLPQDGRVGKRIYDALKAK